MRPELMILILGVVVAVLALIAASIKKYSVFRKNKISMRPNIRIYKDEQTDRPIKLILKNVGSGSAFIDDFNSLIDNIIVPAEREKSINDAVRRLGLNSSDIIYNNPGKDEEILPEKSICLLETNPINIEERNRIDRILSRLTFRIKYRSLYNETFYFNN